MNNVQKFFVFAAIVLLLVGVAAVIALPKTAGDLVGWHIADRDLLTFNAPRSKPLPGKGAAAPEQETAIPTDEATDEATEEATTPPTATPKPSSTPRPTNTPAPTATVAPVVVQGGAAPVNGVPLRDVAIPLAYIEKLLEDANTPSEALALVNPAFIGWGFEWGSFPSNYQFTGKSIAWTDWTGELQPLPNGLKPFRPELVIGEWGIWNMTTSGVVKVPQVNAGGRGVHYFECNEALEDYFDRTWGMTLQEAVEDAPAEMWTDDSVNFANDEKLTLTADEVGLLWADWGGADKVPANIWPYKVDGGYGVWFVSEPGNYQAPAGGATVLSCDD